MNAKSILTLPPIATMLDEAIASRELSFDPAWNMVTGFGGGPGYHTVTKKTDRIHDTRSSAEYAQILLMRGLPADVARAEKILEKLCDLQVTRADSIHYGIWGWFAEEPPEAMRPADWNWADFIGARLAEILVRFPGSLNPVLLTRVKEALGHAARAIIKRNVGPEYTNICTMGAAVVMAAGVVLGDTKMVDYGRDRLKRQRKQMEHDGGVPEYNSPTYTIVMLSELERVVRLVKEEAARADAHWMMGRLYALIAEQFHPPTGQWAGAQSRVYGDVLDAGRVAMLMQRTRATIPVRAGAVVTPNTDLLDFSDEVACPPQYRARFSMLPKSPLEVKQVWTRTPSGEPGTILTTWMDEAACLGSVNRETTWVQRRAVAGYALHPDDFFSSFKIRFLKDGKEFAGGRTTVVQEQNRLLGVLGLALNQGDWHISLDRPKDGIYEAQRLAFRVEFTGREARVKSLPGGIYELSAKGKKLAVHTAEAWFDGKPVSWEIGEADGMAWVECILHRDGVFRFHPGELGESLVPFGMELVDGDAKPSGERIVTGVVDAGKRRVAWKEISVPLLVARRAE